ncbi:phytanoyl-CoA dioxygenase family protein [Acetobacter sp. TBRC 12305]|uniref:Phytanoyl-CoA dioxygenase family protein n=1 Tax=Acetobacter garciniae TaxID=2817435 RepID=A0A939HJC8_9PROT|nr:phytanoyl-CoA dioxygenase family protein [Acetobacter garciniae]MBO1324512.1 phytanoyl-CoA dioxygenase family protein [Acetobacter garciniae]MBX0344201.1 phytanoyl-CoA dioxygenase family protein [Acetobacter garciniae]
MTQMVSAIPGFEQVESFQRDGAVVLRGAFAPWVEILRAGIDRLMADPSPLERSYQPEGSAPFFQDLCNWQRIPEFRDFVERSGVGGIAAALMRAREVRFFHDHVLVKEPGSSVVTPWHQDRPYYCARGPQTVSFWIPLDPVPASCALECVAGSHKWGMDHKPMRFDGTPLYADDDSTPMPDIDANRDAYRILGWDMAPGDAVAFDFGTVHGAAATVGAINRRRVFSARLVGEGATFADRNGKGSPPLAHLTLHDGDPLVGEDFPVLYSVSA